MNRTQARQAIIDAVGVHLASQLTDNTLDAALDRAKTPDSQGRNPGHANWDETYDPHWAAADAVTTLAIQSAAEPGLTKITVEGAAFERTAPDLWQLAALLRAQSPLGQALVEQQTAGIEIVTDTGIVPRSHAENYRTADGLTNR